MADKTVSIRLLVNDQEYAAKMKRVGKASSGAFDDATKKAAKQRKAMDDVSTGFGLLGAAAVAGAGIAVKKFADFDKSMSAVKATGDDARGSMEALRKAAIKAGADTAFSATEAAGGMENLLKAGVSAKDVLGGGLSGALDLAAAGQLGVADAAETAATAMTQFKLEGKDVPHIADLLAAGAGKAQGEVSDMAMALKQSGLVASQFGLSIEDTTGTLGAFASAGLIGSDAGTSFKTMLLALANPAEKTRKKMEELGIAAYDANGNFVGITNLAEQLKTKLGGLDQATRDQALAQIFGNDAIRAANVLYDQGASGIQGWIDKVNDAGYAQKTASTLLDNLAGDLEKLSGSFETALIGVGEGADGPLRNLTQSLSDAVDGFSELPPAAQQATLGIVGGGGLVLLGVAGIGKLVSGAADFKSSLEDLGRTGKFVGGVLKFAGAYGAIVAVGQGIDALGDSMAGLNTDTSELGRSFRDFESSGKISGELAAIVGDNFDKLGKAARTALDPSIKQRADDVAAGLVFMDSETDKARRRFELLDDTLAALDPATAKTAFDSISASLRAQGVTVAEVKKLFPDYQDALRSAGKEQSGSAASASANALSIEQQQAAIENVVPPTENYATALQQAADDAADLKEQTDLLYGALRLLNGENITAEEAAIAFRDQIRGMAGEVKALKEEHGKNGTSLKANTAAGDANRRMLLDGIKAAEDAAEATYQKSLKTKGEEQALKDANAVMGQHVEALRKEAIKLGLNGTEVDKYIAKQLGIPVKQVTNYKAPGLDDALAKAKDLAETIDDTKSKAVSFKMKLDPTGIPQSVLLYKGRSTSGKNRRLAAGGQIHGPGTGTSDEVPAWLSNGEFVMPAKETAANLAALEAARSGAALMAIPRLAKGGRVNTDTVTLGYSTPGMSTALERTGAMANAYEALPGQVAAQLKDWMTEAVENSYTYSDVGGSGVQRWAPMVQRALGIVGQPASYTGITLRRMNQESGGNASIVNRWDSNWQRGTPSVGLMQVIGPTYRAYRHSGYDVGPYLYGTSINPLANTLASMRYALDRYGSLPSAYNRSGGYDNGGWLMPGTTLAKNATGVPERVLSPRELGTMSSSGTNYALEVSFHGPVGSQAELEGWLVKAMSSIQAKGRTRVKIV